MAENPAKKLVLFFTDAKQELKKVNWPTFQELKDSTIVVIIAVLLLGAFIGVIDFLLSKLIEMVIR
ncbi:MAG: preprotein translocase subunit SecE [Chlamydiae bacterium]|nr:preprotein translocase subunit SecE [Chlamydiota bacterium]MBI3277651.1 preprotein translocase subunit SecE [Chlamydiota bacterium]